MRSRLLLAGVALTGACHSSPPASPQGAPSHFLFAWSGDADKKESDFLAVIDVDPRSASYATVVATQPVGVIGTRPHHTDYALPASGILWANGFDSGASYRFDVRDPTRPRFLGGIDATPYTHPHSYAELANGHVLATFQMRAGTGAMATGGLVEFDSAGHVLRSVSAAAAIDSGIRPYSMAVLPALDRIVTSSTDMHLQTRSRAVQIWRLSDLRLLHTILLPVGPLGDEASMTAEPRVLADGRTVLVNTFHCGLYRIVGLTSDAPSAEWVYSTPWVSGQPFCAVPAVAGHFWLQPNAPQHAVVVLDVTDPGHPREVGRLQLQSDEVPHFIALEPNGERILITGYTALESRILLARFDRSTGALRLDSTFTTPGAERPGVDLGRQPWPHGPSGRAIPHGAVFSSP